MRFQFALDTRATPEEVVRAFTDFTDRRPELWKGSLDPAQYEVRELGDTWAVVKEGTARPAVWAVERYDWSRPGTVAWAARESNFCRPGSGVEVRAVPRPDGGSRVHVRWHRSPMGVRGAVIVPLARLAGPRMFRKQWTQVLDGVAAEHGTAG